MRPHRGRKLCWRALARYCLGQGAAHDDNRPLKASPCPSDRSLRAAGVEPHPVIGRVAKSQKKTFDCRPKTDTGCQQAYASTTQQAEIRISARQLFFIAAIIVGLATIEPQLARDAGPFRCKIVGAANPPPARICLVQSVRVLTEQLLPWRALSTCLIGQITALNHSTHRVVRFCQFLKSPAKSAQLRDLVMREVW